MIASPIREILELQAIMIRLATLAKVVSHADNVKLVVDYKYHP